jgi:hypothetical protein
MLHFSKISRTGHGPNLSWHASESRAKSLISLFLAADLLAAICTLFCFKALFHLEKKTNLSFFQCFTSDATTREKNQFGQDFKIFTFLFLFVRDREKDYVLFNQSVRITDQHFLT